tara:strand:- start:179 stop:568 length:390 start_codon:yes stop_codon:yes gene_type:complete
MSEAIGKKVWAFPDAFLPAEGHLYKTSSQGDQFGHESLCIINYDTKPVIITIDFLFEDQDPIENYTFTMNGKRSLHLRLDKLDVQSKKLPREKPYSIILKSNNEVVAQLSRLDTTSEHNAFMTTMGWGG